MIEAKFPSKEGGKKYKFEIIATYSQLKNLMGSTSFDRYLLGGVAQRWDLPKNKEKEIDRINAAKEKNKEKDQNEQSESASVQQSEEGEEQEQESVAEDGVTEAVGEMDTALELEGNEMEDD